MTKESEHQLEQGFVEELQSLGYQYISLPNEEALVQNLRTRLEAFNHCTFSEEEFAKVLNYLSRGNVFDRAERLREGLPSIARVGQASLNIQLLNQEDWSKNTFQVTHQVNIQGSRKNRYDVTLLVNGLPLVQIELKARGQTLWKGFNQINRYHGESYLAGYGLFGYLQFFVISNGVNTRYFANNKRQSKKFTFEWTTEENKKITKLAPFTSVFLPPAHVWKMITQYMVLNHDRVNNIRHLMIMRPYQYYAVEAILQQVARGAQKGGYVWHTTGSGKTLTSFKASLLISQLKEVYKVVFVVDRTDLDEQTIEEFAAYSNSKKEDHTILSADSTKSLVTQLLGKFKDKTGQKVEGNLIVTTIQKINYALKKKKFSQPLEAIKHQKIVFIVDESHRSQFGDTHHALTEFFGNHQVFGFTGTPILEKNSNYTKDYGRRTTKMLFGPCLHYYLVTNAISDQNVLPFSVEYVGKYSHKENANTIDIEVNAINTKELIEDADRIEKITQHILQYHSHKTQNRRFNAIFCVDSLELLKQYYYLFEDKRKAGQHQLKVATIFSTAENPTSAIANDQYLSEEEEKQLAAEPSKAYFSLADKYILQKAIDNYNELFGTSYSNKDDKAYKAYKRDLTRRVSKESGAEKVDILLVIDMFLTGFNSKPTNTLYVDKSLKDHGLIQAFSRTNRIYGEQKSQGNIVCYRNLKKATDEAIKLFSDEQAKDEIFVPPYEEVLEKFQEQAADFLAHTPTLEAVDALLMEDDKALFAKLFGGLLRLLNKLQQYTNFNWEVLPLKEQELEDFKSKYRDLYLQVQRDQYKESILEEVVFETELLQRDKINVQYILRLLENLRQAAPKDRAVLERNLLQLFSDEEKLYSKKKLIQQFINQQLFGLLSSKTALATSLKEYWNAAQQQAFETFCQEEGLDAARFEKVLYNYSYRQRPPHSNELTSCLIKPPVLLARDAVNKRLLERLIDFQACFGVDFEEEDFWEEE